MPPEPCKLVESDRSNRFGPSRIEKSNRAESHRPSMINPFRAHLARGVQSYGSSQELAANGTCFCVTRVVDMQSSSCDLKLKSLFQCRPQCVNVHFELATSCSEQPDSIKRFLGPSGWEASAKSGFPRARFSHKNDCFGGALKTKKFPGYSRVFSRFSRFSRFLKMPHGPIPGFQGPP